MYLVAGDSEALATAMIEGKPVSAALTKLYARVLDEYLADMTKEHGIVVEPEPSNIVPFARR